MTAFVEFRRRHHIEGSFSRLRIVARAKQRLEQMAQTRRELARDICRTILSAFIVGAARARISAMRFLLLNQTFHPDVMATAQYLTDVARALSAAGHEVSVIASRRAYDDPQKQFAADESWNGVRIRRVWTSRLGKAAKWRRAVDFASFVLACAWRLLFEPRPDVVVALTSPPLISFLGACFARLRRARFVYWVMDLNPDEAIAAGWLRERSFVARVLNALSIYSLRTASEVVVLDRFMRERIAAKGIALDKIIVLPPWSQDDAVHYDGQGREKFRAAHGLTDKFVVMYSGNHSPCHPLTNLLEAAKEFARQSSSRVMFCFVGGGSGFAKVKQFAAEHALSNIICLPYRPLNELAASLSAADVHVVVMGDSFVGTIHPCKIYNILAVRTPVLYVGPPESHVTEILQKLASPEVGVRVGHGDIPGTIASINRLESRHPSRVDSNSCERTAREFSKAALMKRLIDLLTKQKSSSSHG